MEVDLSEVVNDPVMAEPFIIHRSTGKFVAGGWQVTSIAHIPAYGVVDVARGKDLEVLPEADRTRAAMFFLTESEIRTTRVGDNTLSNPAGTSDVLEWAGQQWRVLHSAPYFTRGFWKALAERMEGA